MEAIDNIFAQNTKSRLGLPLQKCPNCDNIIGALAGGRDAVCKNCGYKDPCCE